MAYFVLENDTAELAGQLRIVSEPVGAVVFINGQQVQGNTPLIVEKLRAGIPLRIRVELPAHRAPEQNITLSANENREIQFTLRHGSSGVRITSLPRVQVRLDGEWVGVTPLTLDDLPAGPHQLELSNTSLELSVHEPIDLVEGETLRRHYQFTGRLRIDVGRPCRLYRRDKLAGTTPFDARVPVGRHVLVLEDASGERRQLVVDVPLDGEVRVEKPFESLPEVD